MLPEESQMPNQGENDRIQSETDRALARAKETLATQARRIEDLENEVSLLTQWFDHIVRSVEAILSSKRWRLGSFLIGNLSRIIGRPYTPPDIGYMEETLSAFDQWKIEREKVSLKPFLPPPGSSGTAHGELAQVDLLGAPVNFRLYDVIFLANIEWSARFQRPQQLATQFARHGHRVFYVVASETVPDTSARPYSASPVAPNVYEIRLAGPPPADPYATGIDENMVSRFEASLAELRADFQIADAVATVQIPFWAPLALRLRERWNWLLTYDCMDEWDGFPLIGKPLLAAERELVAQCDVVTVTAELLRKKWAPHAKECVLVRNGVDFPFFEVHCQPNDRLQKLEGPVIGYYGALAEWVDFGLIRFLAEKRPEWQFILLGDVFVADLQGLEKMENVHILGRKPYEQMPEYLYHFDVCLIPFLLNDVTHAVDPVKLYEFLSAGKPVVSVPLAELEIYSEEIETAAAPQAFLEKCEEALEENNPALVEKRKKRASENDWQDRYVATHQAITAATTPVSIIVLAYKNPDLTRRCVESVLANTTYPDYELILIDNGSGDETPELLRQFEAQEDHVRLILNEENRGFAAANNQGLKAARGESLVLLNNDTVVPRGWLTPMLAHLKDPKIGLVGPVTNFAGNEARIAVPYFDLEAMPAFAAEHTRAHEGVCFDIDVLAMFCVALRKDVLSAVGFLDERFEIGMFEDDDYSLRVRQSGFRTVCAEDAFVHHFGQAAFKDLLETGEYQRIWDANQSVFEAKWGKWTAHKHREG